MAASTAPAWKLLGFRRFAGEALRANAFPLHFQDPVLERSYRQHNVQRLRRDMLICACVYASVMGIMAAYEGGLRMGGNGTAAVGALRATAVAVMLLTAAFQRRTFWVWNAGLFAQAACHTGAAVAALAADTPAAAAWYAPCAQWRALFDMFSMICITLLAKPRSIIAAPVALTHFVLLFAAPMRDLPRAPDATSVAAVTALCAVTCCVVSYTQEVTERQQFVIAVNLTADKLRREALLDQMLPRSVRNELQHRGRSEHLKALSTPRHAPAGPPAAPPPRTGPPVLMRAPSFMSLPSRFSSRRSSQQVEAVAAAPSPSTIRDGASTPTNSVPPTAAEQRLNMPIRWNRRGSNHADAIAAVGEDGVPRTLPRIMSEDVLITQGQRSSTCRNSTGGTDEIALQADASAVAIGGLPPRRSSSLMIMPISYQNGSGIHGGEGSASTTPGDAQPGTPDASGAIHFPPPAGDMGPKNHVDPESSVGEGLSISALVSNAAADSMRSGRHLIPAAAGVTAATPVRRPISRQDVSALQSERPRSPSALSRQPSSRMSAPGSARRVPVPVRALTPSSGKSSPSSMGSPVTRLSRIHRSISMRDFRADDQHADSDESEDEPLTRNKGLGNIYSEVTVMFVYVSNLSAVSAQLDDNINVVTTLNAMFTMFDDVIERCNVYKVMAIANMYLVVAGAFEQDRSQHAVAMARAATSLMLLLRKNERRFTLGGSRLQFKIGLHTGEVAGGVIGTRALYWHIFGHTVNMASRVCSTSDDGCIQVSAETAREIQRSVHAQGLQLSERGTIDIKGIGTASMWWLTSQELIDYDDQAARASAAACLPVGDGSVTDRPQQHRRGSMSVAANASAFLSRLILTPLSRLQLPNSTATSSTPRGTDRAVTEDARPKRRTMSLVEASGSAIFNYRAQQLQQQRLSQGLQQLQARHPRDAPTLARSKSSKTITSARASISSWSFGASSRHLSPTVAPSPAGLPSPTKRPDAARPAARSRSITVTDGSTPALRRMQSTPTIVLNDPKQTPRGSATLRRQASEGNMSAVPAKKRARTSSVDAGQGLLGVSMRDQMLAHVAQLHSSPPPLALSPAAIVSTPRTRGGRGVRLPPLSTSSSAATSTPRPFELADASPLDTSAQAAASPPVVTYQSDACPSTSTLPRPHDRNFQAFASPPPSSSTPLQAQSSARCSLDGTSPKPFIPAASTLALHAAASEPVSPSDALVVQVDDDLVTSMTSRAANELKCFPVQLAPRTEARYQATLMKDRWGRVVQFVLGSVLLAALGAILELGDDEEGYRRSTMRTCRIVNAVVCGVCLTSLAVAQWVWRTGSRADLSVRSATPHLQAWLPHPYDSATLIVITSFCLTYNVGMAGTMPTASRMAGHMADISAVLHLFVFISVIESSVALYTHVFLLLVYAATLAGAGTRADVALACYGPTLAVACIVFTAGIARERTDRRHFLLSQYGYHQKQKCESMLRNMLPSDHHVGLLMNGEQVVDDLRDVTLLYSDLKGFTALAKTLSAAEVITLLDSLYASFDAHLNHFGLYKVDTIGDAFIVVGGMDAAIQAAQYAAHAAVGTAAEHTAVDVHVDAGPPRGSRALQRWFRAYGASILQPKAALIRPEAPLSLTMVSTSSDGGSSSRDEGERSARPQAAPPLQRSMSFMVGSRVNEWAAARGQGLVATTVASQSRRGSRDAATRVAPSPRRYGSIRASRVAPFDPSALLPPVMEASVEPATASPPVHPVAAPAAAPSTHTTESATPVRAALSHTGAVALLALDMLQDVMQMRSQHQSDLQIRIGLHTGQVVGGIIGRSRPRYFIWGADTVIGNLMESSGVAGQVHVSAPAAETLMREGFVLEPHASIPMPTAPSSSPRLGGPRVAAGPSRAHVMQTYLLRSFRWNNYAFEVPRS